MIYENFQRGINIGGWLSQHELVAGQPLSKENAVRHFKTFIQEDDIRQIAAWQFDHVRLPISGYLIYKEGEDCLNGQALEYIHQCIGWCRKYHLNMVLDLHDIQGNIYGAMEEPMPLLTDAGLQKRFVKIWELLAEEFRNVSGITLMFELLNEVSDASGAYLPADPYGKHYDLSDVKPFLWNRLYRICIDKIRRIDANRWILVGSNGQNSVVYLKELDIIDDPYVFYNFHYYEPQVFTHQQADFSEEMREYNKAKGYPDDISDFAAYLNAHPEWKKKHALTAEEVRNDKALMEKLLRYASDFIHETGREVYCGEFGVIAHAPVAAAKRWVQDLTEILARERIGCALWNYKCLDFGLLAIDGSPCSSLMMQ